MRPVQIDSAQLAQCIEMLRGFILRRFVCGESSRGYGQMFVRALGQGRGDPVTALEAYLLDRGWPDDHQFEAAFVRVPAVPARLHARGAGNTGAGARPQGACRLAGCAGRARAAADAQRRMARSLGSDAERIHADWLHRPGNLTLSAYNQELWNHPFENKRERYAQSNIVITRELAGYSRWGEAEIRARGQQLAREAARIWIGPKEQVAPARADNRRR